MDDYPDMTLYMHMLPSPLPGVVNVGWVGEGP